MPRIPMGNFGNLIAEAPPRMQIPARALRGSGLQQLGELGMSMAKEAMENQNRVQLITGQAEIENGLADLHDKVQRGVQDGTIERDRALEVFDRESKSLISSKASELGQNLGEVVKSSSVRTVGRLQNSIGDTVFKRGQQEALNGLNSFLEANQRLSLEDRALATERSLSAIDAIGPGAGLNPAQVGQYKQKMLESIADQHATRLVSGARNSLADIDSALTALDGKDYSDLDPKRREALRTTLEGHRIRLESRADAAFLRAEAKGEKALNQIDQQIASGIPATPEQWAEWQALTRGTAHEGAYLERIQGERDTQKLLREPFDKQARILQQRETTLMQEGGSLRDKANLDRLRRAVETSRRQLEETPLLFAQSRTGDVVKPINLEALITGTNLDELSTVFADRSQTLRALRQQHGDSVPQRPLVPHEAQILVKVLNRSAPDQQVLVFQGLRRVIGDDEEYQGALSQIAADSPVKALAGTLAARGADIIESHLFSPDQTISAQQTARLALMGESLLNPTRGQKSSDGRTNTWIMPKKADLLRRFADQIGDTFAGTPHAMDAQFELVQATYAGLMASRGGVRNPEILDSAVFDEAIKRTTPVMKQGGVSFLKPVVGMSDDTFREKLRAALPESLKSRAEWLPLRNVRSNQYMILNGARPLTDEAGKPMIVTVQP